MRADWAEVWAEGLENGGYIKGVGGLHYEPDNSYCAGGVLCDLLLLDPSNDAKWIPSEGSDYTEFLFEGESSSFIFPRSVMRFVGLSPKDENIIIAMNEEGKSFIEIAAYIRQRFLSGDSK